MAIFYFISAFALVVLFFMGIILMYKLAILEFRSYKKTGLPHYLVQNIFLFVAIFFIIGLPLYAVLNHFKIL